MPNRFLRGAYQRGKSRLYTSAGFGHWFPFRLGCPAEAPTIVLSA
jgi:predicted MPP superfamily phosphohydrolase